MGTESEKDREGEGNTSVLGQGITLKMSYRLTEGAGVFGQDMGGTRGTLFTVDCFSGDDDKMTRNSWKRLFYPSLLKRATLETDKNEKEELLFLGSRWDGKAVVEVSGQEQKGSMGYDSFSVSGQILGQECGRIDRVGEG